MGFMSSSSTDESKFNMALATLESLRFLMNEAHVKCIEGDAKGWFYRLNAIYKEVFPFIKKPEIREEFERKRKDLFRMLNNTETSSYIEEDLYMLIDEFDMDIRTLMKEIKMLLPLEDNLEQWR